MDESYAVAVLSVEAWNAHLRHTGETLHVYLDGEDVTQRCFRVAFHQDGIFGDVWLYKRNAEGRLYYDPDIEGPAEEVLTGKVEVKPGVAF